MKKNHGFSSGHMEKNNTLPCKYTGTECIEVLMDNGHKKARCLSAFREVNGKRIGKNKVCPTHDKGWLFDGSECPFAEGEWVDISETQQEIQESNISS